MNRSALPPLHSSRVGRTTISSEASFTDSSVHDHQQSALQQRHFMRVGRGPCLAESLPEGCPVTA